MFGYNKYALFAFIALMIIQVSVAVVYKVAQNAGGYHFSPASALAMAEFFKFLMSIGLHFYYEWPSEHSQLPFFQYIQSSVFHVYTNSLPAFTKNRVGQLSTLGLLYAINNHFAFILFLLADASSITLIKSGSSFVSAIFAVFLLGKFIAPLQWVAVLFQVCGLAVTQYNPCNASTLVSFFGYMLLFIHILISSFNAAWNEDLVKSSSSLHLQNIILYFSGTICNFMAYLLFPNSIYGAPPETGFFSGYTPSAIMVVVLNSIIGICITAVYKHADVIVKTFALACSTGSLFVLEWMFMNLHMSILTFVGIFNVYLASYLYLTSTPPKNPNAPPPSSPTEIDDVQSCLPIFPAFLYRRFCAPQSPVHALKQNV